MSVALAFNTKIDEVFFYISLIGCYCLSKIFIYFYSSIFIFLRGNRSYHSGYHSGYQFLKIVFPAIRHRNFAVTNKSSHNEQFKKTTMKNFHKIILAVQFLFLIGFVADKISTQEISKVTTATFIVSPAQQRFNTPSSPGASIGQPMGGNPGGVQPTLAQGTPVTINPILRSLKVTITSPPDAAAIPTQIYVLNQQRLQNVTTNTGVALTYNYPDSNGGNQNSDMVGFNLQPGQLGTPCYGVYIRATADGVADSVGLSDTEPFFITYVGRAWLGIPYIINIDDNETRADNDDSIGVFKFPVDSPLMIDYNTQFGEMINGDATVTYRLVNKFYFYPNFKV